MAEGGAVRERLTGSERRSRIIETAMLLFAQRGFRGATTRAIADRAGISEAMLFKHFPTKRQLYRAIIDAKVRGEPLSEAMARAAARRDDAGVLEAVANQIVRRHRRDPALMRLLLYSALEGHELSKAFYRNRVRLVQEFLSDYIKGRIADGAFRKVDPLVVAQAFTGMVVDHCLAREVFRIEEASGSPARSPVPALVSLFLRGVVRGREEKAEAGGRQMLVEACEAARRGP